MADLTQLIVFVKAPRPGTVKTRLAAELGLKKACTAYRRLVDRLVDRLCRLSSVELRYAPDDAGPETAHWLQDGWTSHPQGHGDLGERMLNAFIASASDGFTRTILIGSDCPYLNADDIEGAANSLQLNDVVLGPAHDGGYWLIGMNEPQPILFEGISWSTGKVLKQTVDRAAAHGLRLHLLRTLSDIDTLADWNTYLAQPNDVGA